MNQKDCLATLTRRGQWMEQWHHERTSVRCACSAGSRPEGRAEEGSGGERGRQKQYTSCDTSLINKGQGSLQARSPLTSLQLHPVFSLVSIVMKMLTSRLGRIRTEKSCLPVQSSTGLTMVGAGKWILRDQTQWPVFAPLILHGDSASCRVLPQRSDPIAYHTVPFPCSTRVVHCSSIQALSGSAHLSMPSPMYEQSCANSLLVKNASRLVRR